MTNMRNGTKEKIKEFMLEQIPAQIEQRIELAQLEEDLEVAKSAHEAAKAKYGAATQARDSLKNQEKIDFESLVDLVKMSGVDLGPDRSPMAHFETLQIQRNARINPAANSLVKDLVERLERDAYLENQAAAEGR